MNTRRKSQSILLGVGIALFLASLFLETLLYAQDSSFLVGFVCLFFGMGYLAWYANPLGVVAAILVLRGKNPWAAGVAVLALACAVSAFLIEEVPRNEAGTMAKVVGYGPGFWLWIGSFALLLAATLCSAIAGRAAVEVDGPAS